MTAGGAETLTPPEPEAWDEGFNRTTSIYIREALKTKNYFLGLAVLLILQTGSFLVKDGRKTGAFFSKNTGVRRAKRRAKFKFCIKKARKFDSRRCNDKSA